MFKRIDRKIFAVIGLFVTLGLVALVLFYSEREERNILAQNKRTLLNVLDTAHQGLRTLMLSGYGDTGQLYVESLESMEGLADFRVMRPDGSQAFLDNQRITQVNQKAGFEQFYPRERESNQEVLPATHSALQQAVTQGEIVEYYDATLSGDRLYTLLYPVKQEPACGKCHIPSQSVLGVIKLTTSLKQVDDEIAASRNLALVVLCLSVLLVMSIIGVFVRRALVPPIRRLTKAMEQAAAGDLSQRVAVPKQLELRNIADSFNTKIAELEATYLGLHQERNKLSTIILGAQEGMIASDAAGQVVLVNPAAEKLLGRNFARLVSDGMESIFNDPKWPQLLGRASTPDSPVVAQLLQQGKTLQIQLASIANEQGKLIGTAVLMRDITQEQALRNQLEHQSRTDALTGLYNRRFFDLNLEAEFRLAQRYHQPVSLVLFDIDHFKRFNDEHGHDQGDRVLQQVAERVKEAVRSVDILCRYGGEEFVIIMPGTSIELSRELTERIRLAVEALRVDGLQVTCSFGVAVAPHPAIATLDQLLKAADAAMYRAKEAGRNCVRSMP